MKFGQRLRELRTGKSLSQRALAQVIGVSHTYVSKIETGNLDFGDFPSKELILKLAKALEADADELLLLAGKVPEGIRRRILERPDAFRKLADLDNQALDELMEQVERQQARC